MPAFDASADAAQHGGRGTPPQRWWPADGLTPPRTANQERKRLREEEGTRIPEMKKLRKKRRGCKIGGVPDSDDPGNVGGPDDTRNAADVACAALEDRRLPPLELGFAEDYICSPATGKLRPGLLRLVKEAAAGADGDGAPAPQLEEEWLSVLGMGFSVLFQGMGSKRSALGALAGELRARGWYVIVAAGYDANFWLPNCLRKVLEEVYPDAPRVPGSSSEALVKSLHQARDTEEKDTARGKGRLARPLCFVVHNVENLPPAHQALLARCVAAPAGGLHLACSIDNLWAPLVWDAQTLKDFNFCRFQVHTGAGYEVENKARYPTPPEWSGLSGVQSKVVKDSLAIVLRSLTPNHRELVQVLAEHQEQQQGGRKGISQSELLRIAQDRMIASTATKLRPLVNELRDHDVIQERNAQDGGRLYHLHHSADTIRRLRAGQTLEEGDHADDGAA